MLRSLNRAVEVILEWTLLILMVALTAVVIVAVLFRIAGNSLSWYDEVAAIQLSWVTYFGAGLAALKRRHIGFDSVLLAIPAPSRMLAVMIAEIVVIGFFLLLTWTGLQVLQVLSDERLVSLTWVPVRLTQSIIPIGGFLFILGELLSLPSYWRATAAGISLEQAEIEDEVATELKKAAEAD